MNVTVPASAAGANNLSVDSETVSAIDQVEKSTETKS
jgi:hypothetical protein